MENRNSSNYFFVHYRNRDDKLFLRNDDMLILEVKERILQRSLKEHINETNQITMEIRTGKREEFEEIKINIT